MAPGLLSSLSGLAAGPDHAATVIVMKFGGTSLADAERIRAVEEIVRGRAAGQKVVVVVSAQAGVTNDLRDLAHRAVKETVRTTGVRKRYRELLGDLGLDVDLLADDVEELRALLKGISLVGDLTPRSLDRMMSFGERFSSRVVAATLEKAGLRAQACLSYELGLVTDSAYGCAQVLESSYDEVPKRLGPMLDGGVLPVVTGFIAKDAEGYVTTVGRGGSDYTAAILGRALGAREIELWTDVDGVMTADPRMVDSARSLESMSFAEASELAYYGAKVIHPATIQPAIKADIPIRVLNTYEPDSPGTLILRKIENGGSGPRSIATKGGITLVHVTSMRMLLQPGFMARLFQLFETHGVVIDMISTSEVSVTLTTDTDLNLEGARQELATFAEVRVEPDKAILCLVGEGLRDADDLLPRVFETLRGEKIPVRMVSVGASRINVSLLVDAAHEGAAVRALHREFFGS